MKFEDLPIGTFFRFHPSGTLCLKTGFDAYQPAGYKSGKTRCLQLPVIIVEEDFDGRPTCGFLEDAACD